MLTGLDILLARMKTNPEEFLKDAHVPYEGEMFGGKWSDLLDYAWRVADDEERKALDDARKEFYRDDFNERVMKRLAGEEVKQVEQPSPYIVKGSSVNAIHPMQNAAAQNSLLIGNDGRVSQYNPNTHGYATLTGFQAAELKQEGMPISNGGTGFLGLGKLFWGKK